MEEVVSEKNQSEPFLLVTGNMEEPEQCFLVVDQEILFESDIMDSVLSIISAFFVFNICYTKSMNNVFTFLERVLLDVGNKLPISVSNFLSLLS